MLFLVGNIELQLYLKGDEHFGKKVKAGFVEKIGSTVFIVNAMPSENASETQEELVKALIIKDVMASKPGTTAQDFTLGSKV